MNSNTFLYGMAMYGLGILTTSIPYISVPKAEVGILTAILGSLIVIGAFFIDRSCENK